MQRAYLLVQLHFWLGRRTKTMAAYLEPDMLIASISGSRYAAREAYQQLRKTTICRMESYGNSIRQIGFVLLSVKAHLGGYAPHLILGNKRQINQFGHRRGNRRGNRRSNRCGNRCGERRGDRCG